MRGRIVTGAILLLLVGASCSSLGDDPFGDAAIADAPVSVDARPPADAPPVVDAGTADAEAPDAVSTAAPPDA